MENENKKEVSNLKRAFIKMFITVLSFIPGLINFFNIKCEMNFFLIIVAFLFFLLILILPFVNFVGLIQSFSEKGELSDWCIAVYVFTFLGSLVNFCYAVNGCSQAISNFKF